MSKYVFHYFYLWLPIRYCLVLVVSSTNSSNCSADVKFVTALCSARELKYYGCIGSAYEKFAVLTGPKNRNVVHESEQTTKLWNAILDKITLGLFT
jgi:hypothetical protein